MCESFAYFFFRLILMNKSSSNPLTHIQIQKETRNEFSFKTLNRKKNCNLMNGQCETICSAHKRDDEKHIKLMGRMLFGTHTNT